MMMMSMMSMVQQVTKQRGGGVGRVTGGVVAGRVAGTGSGGVMGVMAHLGKAIGTNTEETAVF